MKRTVILAATILIAAAGARAQPWTDVKLELKAGESASVGSEGLVVGFDGVPSDSRCPIGLLCFWEGDAVAEIWATLPAEEKKSFELHTHRSFGWKASYHGYEISLTAVEPYPHYGIPIPPGDYVASLTVTCCKSLSPVESGTWGRIKSLYR